MDHLEQLGSAGSADQSERALVERARRGDEAAFRWLVEKYGGMVLSLAYASTLNRADAEEVAQETFLSAWRGLARFRGDAAFSTWLYELARSRCADRARRTAARPSLVEAQDGHADRGAEPTHHKTVQAIFEAAARLPLAQRQAVLMRDIQGLSYEEIAALQDVPVGTVRSRIANGRAAIADDVGEP